MTLQREHVTVTTPWGPVRIKRGLREGVELNAAPEFDDCRKIAEAQGRAGQTGTRDRAPDLPTGEARVNPEALLKLLAEIRDGKVTPEQGTGRLARLPFEDLEFAKVDHHRALRTGLPEVIFAAGKTDRQVVEIFERMAAQGGNVLATRIAPSAAHGVCALIPKSVHHETARAVSLRQQQTNVAGEPIPILCAGTSDLPVAEEAAITAELLGYTVKRIYDVGVAGLHRLLAHHATLVRGAG